MKIQRFKGRDLQEALHLAQQALGPEAVILQTRRLQNPGLMRLVPSTQVEILAALDPQRLSSPKSSGVRGGSANGVKWVDPERMAPPSRLDPGPRSAAQPSPTWQSELSELRREMAVLRDLLARPDSVPEAPAEAPSTRHTTHDAPISSVTLAGRVLNHLVTRTIALTEGECRTVALVGPTGVGKTTTLAKLAAAATHAQGRQVALVTLDTFRIGAVEQLETYARLLDLPISVVYSADDAVAARERHGDCDLILIDTLGCSPLHTGQVGQLTELLAAIQPDETHLALDARASIATLRAVLTGFAPLQPTHLLLSKLDEAARLEDALTAALEADLPLSYVTIGQRVPEDLGAADPQQLADWLLERE